MDQYCGGNKISSSAIDQLVSMRVSVAYAKFYSYVEDLGDPWRDFLPGLEVYLSQVQQKYNLTFEQE